MFAGCLLSSIHIVELILFFLNMFAIYCCFLVDLVLNVRAMRQVAALIGSQVTIYEIENAKHDIFLSKESVREKAFHLMFRWLKHLEDDWAILNNVLQNI